MLSRQNARKTDGVTLRGGAHYQQGSGNFEFHATCAAIFIYFICNLYNVDIKNLEYNFRIYKITIASHHKIIVN